MKDAKRIVGREIIDEYKEFTKEWLGDGTLQRELLHGLERILKKYEVLIPITEFEIKERDIRQFAEDNGYNKVLAGRVVLRVTSYRKSTKTSSITYGELLHMHRTIHGGLRGKHDFGKKSLEFLNHYLGSVGLPAIK